MNDFDIIIMSVPHRDKLIAEISYKKFAIAEINIDSGIPKIEFFIYPENKSIQQVPLEEFIYVLEEARNRLKE